MCAGKEMWTAETETRQVRRLDEEPNNALAWDSTRPFCVSNGSASAATIQVSKGIGKV